MVFSTEKVQGVFTISKQGYKEQKGKQQNHANSTHRAIALK